MIDRPFHYVAHGRMFTVPIRISNFIANADLGIVQIGTWEYFRIGYSPGHVPTTESSQTALDKTREMWNAQENPEYRIDRMELLSLEKILD